MNFLTDSHRQCGYYIYWKVWSDMRHQVTFFFLDSTWNFFQLAWFFCVQLFVILLSFIFFSSNTLFPLEKSLSYFYLIMTLDLLKRDDRIGTSFAKIKIFERERDCLVLETNHLCRTWESWMLHHKPAEKDHTWFMEVHGWAAQEKFMEESLDSWGQERSIHSNVKRILRNSIIVPFWQKHQCSLFPWNQSTLTESGKEIFSL